MSVRTFPEMSSRAGEDLHWMWMDIIITWAGVPTEQEYGTSIHFSLLLPEEAG